MNRSAHLLFSFSLLGLIQMGCGDGSEETDDETGATGGSSPGDGDGDGDGDGSGGTAAGTGGSGDGDGDGDAPEGSLTERAQNLDVTAELSVAAGLCETQRVKLRHAYDLAADTSQSSMEELLSESEVVNAGASETFEAVFFGDEGSISLTWTSPSPGPNVTTVSGELQVDDAFEPLGKCFSGYASLAQEVEGENYYVFVATQFADSGNSGCAGITPSTLGLVHGCISTATY